MFNISEYFNLSENQGFEGLSVLYFKTNPLANWEFTFAETFFKSPICTSDATTAPTVLETQVVFAKLYFKIDPSGNVSVTTFDKSDITDVCLLSKSVKSVGVIWIC